MLPEILVCSAILGKCFTMSSGMVVDSRAACEAQVLQIRIYAMKLIERGKMPEDLWVEQNRCTWKIS